MQDAPPTTDVVRSRYWLGESFVVETAPVGEVLDVGVLLLPPLGYEDTSAYRPLRGLATALARAGCVVLRLDWPGLGDAAGSVRDDDLHPRRLAAVHSATAELRRRGVHTVAALGVRAGGLLAIDAGGLDAVALWGTPPTGKAWLREERTFHKLAARAFAAPPVDAAPLPDGALEAGGFYHPPGVVRAMEGLVGTARLGAPLDHLRVHGRDGSPPAPEWVAAAEAAGVQVQVSTTTGLTDVLEDPYRSRLADAVRDELTAWFTARAAGRVSLLAASGRPALVLPAGATERVWSAPGGAGELVGVVCEPAGGAAPGATWTVFYNAGGVRRSGPNRLWTETARALAAAGHPSLRLDVRSVGDSAGVDVPHHDLEEMYSEDSVEDALVAWEAVRGLGAGSVDVVGLCSGAFLGAQVAARRDVRRAVLFNGLAFVWNDEARAHGMTSQIGRSLFDARRWKRLLTGRIDARALARAMVDKARLRLDDARARLRGEPPPDDVARLFRQIRTRGTEVCLVSSAGDPSVEYLAAHVPEDQRPSLTILPGVDHTIRPVWAHERVSRLILAGARSPHAR